MARGKKCEKQPWCRHQGEGRRGGGGSRCWSRDSHVAFGEDHGEAGCPPADHERPHQSRYPHCSPQRIPCWIRWTCPEGTATFGEPK